MSRVTPIGTSGAISRMRASSSPSPSSCRSVTIALSYGGKHLLDLELQFPLPGGTTLAAGGQNVLNTYPDEHPFARQRLGNRYSQFTPFGFNGGYYYLRISHAWGSGA